MDRGSSTLPGALFLGTRVVGARSLARLAGQLASGLRWDPLLLIVVVSVVIETVKQVESQLTMRQYDAA